MSNTNEYLEQARKEATIINRQFLAPLVVEATDNIINLIKPFTLHLPAITSNDDFSDVLLVFVNEDGTFSPQEVVHKQAVSGLPTEGKVDNNFIVPPFNRDHSAVLQCFLRLKSNNAWQRTPDSVVYRFKLPTA